MRNIFFIVIGLFVLLSSCRVSRQASTSSATESTTVSFREVEKIVRIPGDSVTASMQVAFDTPIGYSGSGALINGTLPEREAVEGRFTPQVQTIETKRTKVTVELTKTGEIKATAICKELEEKVTVQETTITKSKSEVIVVQEKESWFQRTLKAVKKSFNTILIIAFVVVFLYVIIRFKGRILNIFK